MKQRKSVVYKKDIIKQVAEKLGEDEKTVEHVLNFSIYRLKKLSRSNLSIKIPHIGIFYLKEGGLIKKHQRFVKKYGEDSKEAKSVWNKIEEIREKTGGKFTIHRTRSKIRDFTFTTSNNLEKIEVTQNEEWI
jgi:nucleoid DNA-binding protein